MLTLPSGSTHPKAKTEGFMTIEVDDIVKGGGEKRQGLTKKMESILKFGKIDELYGAEGSNYAGRFIRQLPDYSFSINMEEFIYTRLEPIKLSRKVLKKDAAAVDLSPANKHS